MKHKAVNIPMSIIISGVESDTYFDIVVRKSGVRFVLMSYHYLQKKSKDFLKKRIEEFPDLKVFIDSGAHTFLANSDKFQDKPLKYWEDYLESYTNWVKENSDYIFACANLDLEFLVGNDKVDEWNDKYFKSVEETGIEVCYIWHTPRGEQGWEQMCRKHSYIGMSMENDKEVTVQRLMKRMKVAQKYNTKVHGMALTKTEILVRVPFFSADSSVDGESSILVKDLNSDRTERMTIEELYNRNIEHEFRTTKFETRVPYNNYKVLTVDDNNKVIWGDLYGVVKHKVKKPTVKLKIEGGRDITCTTDHSIITMDKKGNLIETKADELKVGDFALSPKQYDLNNELTPFTNVLIDKPNTQQGEKEWQVVELSDKFLQFLGLWVGDGHFSSDTIGLSCYQDLECREVIDYIANLYKAKVSLDKNGVDARISNVRLQRVMRALGFEGTSLTKRIPKFIYSLSKGQICQFLKGYFSADGTGSCECSTVSKELKDDLLELLSMLGINTSTSYRSARPCNIRGKKGTASQIWHLSIRNKQSKIIFKDNIGFLQEYKNTKLNEIITTTPDREPKCAGIPKSLATGTVIRTDSNHSTSIARWKGNRISRKYVGVFEDKVRDSHLWFYEIKNIEVVNDGSNEVEVYDLSVKHYERFFANGILVHNTTWLVGQQYGELNWFDGRKMRRLGKNDWRREYKTKLLKPPFNADWDRLINGMGGRGDTYELLRLNVIAYKLAEEYIRKRLKTKMYWMKGGTTQMSSEAKLKQLDLPEYEWYHSEDNLGWEDHMIKMGISPIDYTRDEGVNILYFFFLLLVDTEDHIDELDDEMLITYAQSVSDGEEIGDRESAIGLLTDYYRGNATGERTDFVGEESMAIAKERDNYVTEDEFTVIDLSANELEQNFGLSLPAPRDNSMPEVDEFDEELKRQDIVAVRDKNGKFIKGQKKVKKPKNVYSEKFPKLNCDTCYKSGECPQYKAGFVCAFDKMFKRFDSRNLDDVVESMQGMVNFNMQRLQRAMIFETMDGGMVTAEVSNLIDQNMKLMTKMQEILNNSPKAVVSQKRVIREDGSEEVVTEMNVSNPASGGILSRLFMDSEGDKKKSKKDDTEIVDADYKVE